MTNGDRLSDIRLSFGRHAFEDFVGFLLSRAYAGVRDLNFTPLCCYERPLETTSLHSPRGISIVDYLPLEPFGNLHGPAVSSPAVVETLRQITDARAAMNRDEVAFAFMTGLSGVSDDILADEVAPQYRRTLDNAGYGKAQLLIASVDTLLRHPDGRAALGDFVHTHTDGLSIYLGADGPSVKSFAISRIVTAGVSHDTRSPLEPMRSVSRARSVLQAFESLLSTDPKERTIEEFLRANYREIFGFRYDRIATQLWLVMPEADLGRRKRRADLFLRNAVTSDWELVELKRSRVKLTGTNRDLPMLSRQVHAAIQQAKNYQRILQQDRVRRALAKEGIDYCEPTARLVIGRRPAIALSDWRWLCATYGRDPELLTYDDLLLELRCRADHDDQLWSATGET